MNARVENCIMRPKGGTSCSKRKVYIYLRFLLSISFFDRGQQESTMYVGRPVLVLFLIILAFTLSVDCRRCRGNLCNNNRLKFLLVSDIHLNPFYNKSLGASTWCSPLAGSSVDYEAPYGRIGCDSPEDLLTITLAGMKKKGNDAKFVILSGIVGDGRKGLVNLG